MTSSQRIARSLAVAASMLIALPVVALPGDDLGGLTASRLRLPAQAGPNTVLGIRGSTTWEPVNQVVPTRFEFVEPKVSLRIETPPGGSSFGIRQLIEGNCVLQGITDPAVCDVNGDGVVEVDDLLDGSGPGFVPGVAQSSRRIKASELAVADAAGLQVVGVNGAIDGLAIVVNVNNPLGTDPVGLSIADVADIYLNDDRSWSNYVGDAAFNASCPSIRVISRTAEGGTFGSFVDFWIEPAGGSEADIVAKLGGLIEPVDTALEGVAEVAADECAIFYAGIGDFNEDPNVVGVRAYPTSPADGAFPTFDTTSDGSYPFSRTMWLYTVGVPTADDARAKYLDWMLSRAGQSAIAEAGFVPAYRFLKLFEQQTELLATYPEVPEED